MFTRDTLGLKPDQTVRSRQLPTAATPGPLERASGPLAGARISSARETAAPVSRQISGREGGSVATLRIGAREGITPNERLIAPPRAAVTSDPFFITGPADRMPWLAALATTRLTDCLCGWSTRQTWESLRDFWTMRGERRIGIADEALGEHLDRILAEIAPRTLVVTHSGPFSSEFSSEPMAHPLVRTIPIEALGDIGSVREALEWLGIEPANLDQMMRLRAE